MVGIYVGELNWISTQIMGDSEPVKVLTVHSCWGCIVVGLDNIWVALSTDFSVEQDVKVCENVKDVQSGMDVKNSSEFQELI